MQESPTLNFTFEKYIKLNHLLLNSFKHLTPSPCAHFAQRSVQGTRDFRQDHLFLQPAVQEHFTSSRHASQIEGKVDHFGFHIPFTLLHPQQE